MRDISKTETETNQKYNHSSKSRSHGHLEPTSRRDPLLQFNFMSQEQLINATLQNLQQQINVLQQANAALQQKQELQRNGLELHQHVKERFAAHLQHKQILEPAERKRTLSAYPKSNDLPSALIDSNGLAAKAVGDGQARKWALTQLPALQRETLDILRVAATGLHMGLAMQNQQQASAEQCAHHLSSVLEDVIKLACDNAQRLAKTQLETIFEAAKAKGAYALLCTDPDEEGCDVDEKNDNILQAAHVDAMAEIKKYNKSVEVPKQNNRNGGGRGGNGGGRGGGNGWRRRGRGGNNNFRGNNNNYRGNNNYNNNRGNSGSDGGSNSGSGSAPNGNSGQ
jgi:hypothetical protein